MTKFEYPELKKALWEAWREFIPAFVVAVGLQLSIGIDMNQPLPWIVSVATAGIKAGWRAVFKWLRDKYGEGDYDKLIYKIPS